MDKDTTKLLMQILSNQVVIYKRLEKIEKKIGGGVRTAPIKTYVDELKEESNKVLQFIQL